VDVKLKETDIREYLETFGLVEKLDLGTPLFFTIYMTNLT
jgi:hypothetical protein